LTRRAVWYTIWYLKILEAAMTLATSTNSSTAYDRLREAILALELGPGSTLTERALETRLETSRTTVRAALARLENEGLVNRDGRGYQVAPLDLLEIKRACDWREVIETAAARTTIDRLHQDRATNAELEQLAQHLGTLAATEPLETQMRDATDFHINLARLAANPFMTRALEDVLTRLARARWFEAASTGFDRANREHRQILQAIQARDINAAEREIKAHLARSRDRLLNALLESSQLQVRGQVGQSKSLSRVMP
jgi:DNA-binding GntR family transcriptional regulator